MGECSKQDCNLLMNLWWYRQWLGESVFTHQPEWIHLTFTFQLHFPSKN